MLSLCAGIDCAISYDEVVGVQKMMLPASSPVMSAAALSFSEDEEGRNARRET
jgi:hypothetical protein